MAVPISLELSRAEDLVWVFVPTVNSSQSYPSWIWAAEDPSLHGGGSRWWQPVVTPVSPSYTLTQLLPYRETLGGQPVQREFLMCSSLCSLAPPRKCENVTRSVVSDFL